MRVVGGAIGLGNASGPSEEEPHGVRRWKPAWRHSLADTAQGGVVYLAIGRLGRGRMVVRGGQMDRTGLSGQVDNLQLVLQGVQIDCRQQERSNVMISMLFAVPADVLDDANPAVADIIQGNVRVEPQDGEERVLGGDIVRLASIASMADDARRKDGIGVGRRQNQLGAKLDGQPGGMGKGVPEVGAFDAGLVGLGNAAVVLESAGVNALLFQLLPNVLDRAARRAVSDDVGVVLEHGKFLLLCNGHYRRMRWMIGTGVLGCCRVSDLWG